MAFYVAPRRRFCDFMHIYQNNGADSEAAYIDTHCKIAAEGLAEVTSALRFAGFRIVRERLATWGRSDRCLPVISECSDRRWRVAEFHESLSDSGRAGKTPLTL